MLQFKTNIHCGNCIRTVTPFLAQLPTIERWEVDTEHPDHILRVYGDQVAVEDVTVLVQEAGFRIEPLEENKVA